MGACEVDEVGVSEVDAGAFFVGSSARGVVSRYLSDTHPTIPLHPSVFFENRQPRLHVRTRLLPITPHILISRIHKIHESSSPDRYTIDTE